MGVLFYDSPNILKVVFDDVLPLRLLPWIIYLKWGFIQQGISHKLLSNSRKHKVGDDSRFRKCRARFSYHVQGLVEDRL